MTLRRRPDVPDQRPPACPVCARRGCHCDLTAERVPAPREDWTPWSTALAANA